MQRWGVCQEFRWMEGREEWRSCRNMRSSEKERKGPMNSLGEGPHQPGTRGYGVYEQERGRERELEVEKLRVRGVGGSPPKATGMLRQDSHKS